MKDEQLESLLRAADESAGWPADPSPHLADRVRVARSRRVQRTMRVKFAGALTVCYVAGMVTTWILFVLADAGGADVAQQLASSTRSAGQIAEVPPIRQREQKAPEGGIETRTSPVQRGFVAESSRYDLLRQMGDESQRRGDLQAAVAYYGRALDAASEAEQKISYEYDNWLLISLKRDNVASQQAPVLGDAI